MALSPKTENALRHLILLSAIHSGPPELHRAVMSDDNEEALHDAILAHAKSLHDKIAASANGAGQPAPEAGESTASKAVKLFNAAPADGESTSAPSKADKASDRAKKVSQYFKK